MNNVVLVGRLTKDPELRYVGEKNNALTNFSLAVDRGYKNSQGESKVDFINIEIWGRQAEIFCTYMAKGKMVGIEGKIIADRYKNENGENRYITRVRANSFRFLDSRNKNIDIDEINRVLKKDGIFVRVLPRTNHLIELRNIIYSVVKLNDKVYKPDSEKDEYINEVNVTYNLELNNEEVTSLLKMTPHYWKSTPENKEKLEAYKELNITVDMRIGVFKKKS